VIVRREVSLSRSLFRRGGCLTAWRGWPFPSARKYLDVFLLALVFVLSSVSAVSAAAPFQRPGISKEAEIVSAQGESRVLFVSGKDWIDALRQQILTGGDAVKTGRYGKMGILFAEGTQIKVNRNSTLRIKSSKGAGAKGTVLELEGGEVWSRARAVPGGLRIETPSATAAIRGTDWNIFVDESGASYLTVVRGIVGFYNDFGTVVVNPGEQAMAMVGRPPVKTMLVRPRDRVQWVISYSLSVPDLVRFHPYSRGEMLKEVSSTRERLTKNPSDRASRLFLAELLFDLRRRRESRTLAHEVLSTDPSNRRALILLGSLALDADRADEARGYFERVLESGGAEGRQDALIGLVGVSLAGKEVERAGRFLESLAGEGRSPLIDLVSASFDATLGDFRKALKACTDSAGKYPSDERFRILAAGLSLLMDERNEARGFLGEAIALNPESSEAYAVLGAAAYLEGRGNDAEEAYRKSLAFDPDNGGAMNGLGVLLMERGYYEEAERVFSKAIEVAPRGTMTWANRGILFAVIEDLPKARGDFAKSLEIDPTNFATLNGQGLVALKEGRNREAADFFLKASLLDPRFSLPHSMLAIAYYQQGGISIGPSKRPVSPNPWIQGTPFRTGSPT